MKINRGIWIGLLALAIVLWGLTPRIWVKALKCGTPLIWAQPEEEEPIQAKPNPLDRDFRLKTGIRSERQHIQGLTRLGFQIGKVTKLKSGIYSVKINGFRAKTSAIAQKGAFKPCTIKVKVSGGKVYLDGKGLEQAGFNMNPGQLPGNIRLFMPIDPYGRGSGPKTGIR